MKIRISTPNHHLTKKQKVLLENLAFTENWETGHGRLESLELDSDSEIDLTADELKDSGLRWEVIA